MKFIFALAIALFYNSVFSEAKPKVAKTNEDNKLEDHETKVSNKSEDPLSKLEIPAKSSDSLLAALTELKSIDNGDSKVVDNSKVPAENTIKIRAYEVLVKKCPDVVCAPPPSDGNCETSNDPSLNVMSPIMGPLSECCQLWICSRSDGSIFTHYGISTIGGKAPEFTNVFSTHFSHSTFGLNPSKNYVLTSGSYGVPNNFAGIDSGAYSGQGQGGQQFTAGGFSTPFLNYNPISQSVPYPLLPVLSIPYQQQQIQQPTPYSTWGVYRGRRDSQSQLPQSPQNVAQPKHIRQGVAENGRRYPIQLPQFY